MDYRMWGVGAVFRSWGQPLSATRLASFRAVPLTRHAEIVLEVGPHVPPHSSYAFPPGS
jgi:hypothetical protein